MENLSGKLNRDSRTLMQHWLFAKSCDAAPPTDDVGAPWVPFTSADLKRFQKDWYEIDCPAVTPGDGHVVSDKGVFDFLTGKYFFRSGKSEWAIQTLGTGLKSNRQADRSKEAVEVRETEASREIRLTEGSLDAMRRHIAGKVNPVSLAAWRYRHTPLPAEVTKSELFEKLREELSLSDDEVTAVFVPEDQMDLRAVLEGDD